MNQKDLFEGEMSLMDRLRDNWDTAIRGKGGTCPCCKRWGKVNKHKLNQGLALSLRWIFIHGGEDGWVNVQKTAPRFMLGSKTYSLLAHWNLIESKGKRSGVWRVTADGKRFINGETTQPSAVFVYDNIVWGYEDVETSFRGCFGKHFDFDEMMSARFDWSSVRGKREKRK